MKWIALLFLPILGGILSWLAWPDHPLFFCIFFAWVPLLFVEDYLTNRYESPSKLRLFPFALLFFLTWNLLTTWWLWYADPIGSVLANGVNSLLMCIPILLFHQSKKRFGINTGYLSLVVFWLSFEYLHMRWEMSWPWLNLGNVFATYPAFVQWYEFTGPSGGTLWVLLFNILLFTEAKKWSVQPPNIQGFGDMVMTFGRLIWKPSLLLLIPLVISLVMYQTHQEKGEEVEIVVLQPNIDPYKKFQRSMRSKNMRDFLESSESKITANTKYVVWPETAIPHYIRFHNWDEYESIQMIEDLLERHPHVSLVTGASTLYHYKDGEQRSKTARKFRTGEGYFDSYNSALQFDYEQEAQVYHKSKLVPGAERMPYAHIFSFLIKYVANFGSIAGSLGTQAEREVFDKDGLKIAPVICYESIFGDYMTQYMRKGANLIFIVTNDAWWNNTKGHRHHLRYASLRAIESRRSIARSANTGISCFVDQRGDIHQATQYGEHAVLNGRVRANEEITFFVRWGDLLGRISLFVAIFLFLNVIVDGLTKGTLRLGGRR